MSVYTAITKSELESFLLRYEVGALVQFEGIRGGIINTNFFVTTRLANCEHRFVLTIFETLPQTELPYFLNLMAYLSEHDLPIAHPVADHTGAYLQTLKDKPAALIQRLNGDTCHLPTLQQCTQAGAMLGQLHKAGASFTAHRNNDHGLAWCHKTAAAVVEHLSAEDAQLLHSEIELHASADYKVLPDGVVHADFFSDNLLFDDNKISGVIDFYFACNDKLLYDIAIAVNDWCGDAQGNLKLDYASAFLGSYHRVRPLLENEKSHWPAMLRVAALRFWLSRLFDKYFPRSGTMTFIKDPDEFKNALLKRIAATDTLRSLWPA